MTETDIPEDEITRWPEDDDSETLIGEDADHEDYERNWGDDDELV